MDESLVLCKIDPAGHALLTLNRPAQLNALSRALMAQLTATIAALEAAPAVRVLILSLLLILGWLQYRLWMGEWSLAEVHALKSDIAE